MSSFTSCITCSNSLRFEEKNVHVLERAFTIIVRREHVKVPFPQQSIVILRTIFVFILNYNADSSLLRIKDSINNK